MEQKNNITKCDPYNGINKEKFSSINQNIKKARIKKINPKVNSMVPKKTELNNLTILNESKKKQKQIKQCLYDLTKTKEKKEKSIKKEKNKIVGIIKKNEEKQKSINNDINKTSLKENNNDFNKNIKVNKIKIEKINLDNVNNINSVTNRDFYQKSYEKNKNFNLISECPNISNNKEFNNSRKTNIISVKSFNRSHINKDLLYSQFRNSEFINFISPFNKETNNCSKIDNNKSNNRYNLSSNTFSNTTAGKSRISNNSSKFLISFKNIKTFYAHLEIFVSLYLKRIFKIFLQKINYIDNSKNINISNIDLLQKNGEEGNNNRPIVNVNNAHCSLYCSINVNEDKLFNTIFENHNTNSFINNGLTPLTRRTEVIHNKGFIKEEMNNNKRNRLLYINPQYDINLSTNKKFDKTNKKSVYVPKKKINKNNTDLDNNIKTSKNISDDKLRNKKSSPIKEMNINLKQINVCRLNDLNQLYLNHNLYKNNNNNFSFSEINPIIKINNNNTTSHSKFNSNNIYSMNNLSNNNISKEKNKLKKIQSAKNGIYIKPKEKNRKRKIKEIKIQNKLSPIKNEIEYHKRSNIKTDIDMLNNYSKDKYINGNTKIKDSNLYTINNERDENTIKKIYIKRSSQNKTPKDFNIKETLFDSYKKKFYSTFLDFNKNNTKIYQNLKKEILIKQIKTSDKRLFINIKYFILENDNYINNNKNIPNLLSLKVNHQCSITIINNKLSLIKEFDANMLVRNLCNYEFKVLDIFSFDNDKKEENKENKSKNISFSFKEYSPSKEESIDIKSISEGCINFIKAFNNIIIINIRKYILNKCKIKLCLKKLLNIKKKKIIKYYFSKYKNIINHKQIKIDKNNYGVYHKINYNDDFNLNKKLKTPKHIQKNDSVNKTKIFNLNLYSSSNVINSKNKINDKKRNNQIISNTNYKKTSKYMNKEINIFVHNNYNTNSNNIAKKNMDFTKLKNKFYLMRIKLIKNALKMIKNAL